MRFTFFHSPARLLGLAVPLAFAILALPGDPAWALVSVNATQAPRIVRPGGVDHTVFEVTVTNQNLLIGTVRVNGLRLTNTTQGPGTIEERDAELGFPRLYRDNGTSGFDRGDILLDSTKVTSGVLDFTGFNVPIQPGNSGRFLVVLDVPLRVRDGDALDLVILTEDDISFVSSEQFQGTSFPLAPAGVFPLDGMVAAQIDVSKKSWGSVIAGTQNNLALDAVLPANGYEADKLETIEVVNTGTALAGTDLTGMTAWVDDGDGSFDPDRDREIGALSYVGGSRWVRSGIGETVPVEGLRLLVTVDVGDLAIEGRSIRLAIPTLPDAGVGMASSNNGPIDLSVEAPERTVSTANRLTLSATPLAPVTTRPGAHDVVLLHFSVNNSYGSDQVMSRLTVENAGIGGNQAQRDAAVQALTLRMDGNGDGALGDSLTDPPLASAFFSGGQASFVGFTAPLVAGATRHFFVTAQVALTTAADGDTLSTRVAGPLDVGLGDTTRVVASWPLDSRARAAVDGMIAAQLTSFAVPVVALAPGDSAVLAMDVIVPRNGWANDLLQILELVNLGTADNDDLADVRWWWDGGDGAFTPGSGDDVDLGVAVWTGSGWRLAGLAVPLNASGARLFASFSVVASPTDSVTVRFAIPTAGVTVASGNDGPLDAAVACPTVLTVSASPLLASLEIEPAASVPGQQVTVTMVVRNAGLENLIGITPSGLTQSGTGSLNFESGPLPASVDLAPGERDTLVWTYRAATPGDVVLTGWAQGTESPSGTPRRSLDAVSESHHIFDSLTHLDGDFDAALPAVVNRGQTGIVAFTLGVSNGNSQGSPARFLGLRIGLEDEFAAGVVPDSLLARVAVQQGTTTLLVRTSLETSGSEVDLTLATPVLIGAGETANLTVSIDLKASTPVPAFRVSIEDSLWLQAEDATSGAPISVRLIGGSFPARTGLARVFEPPTRVEVRPVPAAEIHAGPGQTDVPLLSFRLQSPGADGITSDVRVGGLALDASDTLGVPVALLADVVSHVVVRTGFQTVASRAVLVGDGPKLTLLLSPGVNVPVNTPVDVFVDGDIANLAAARAFRLRLADSTLFDARDAVTRDPVSVVFESDPLPGRTVIVEMPADSVLVAGTPRFPVGVRAGDAGVPAMALVLRHPGGPGDAPLRVDSLIVLSRDQARRPVAPALFLDALRVRWNGVDAGGNGDPPTSGEATGIDLGGRLLAAGDSATIELSADLSVAAPEGFLELSVFADGLPIYDANLGSPATVVPVGGQLPFTSGLTRVQAPARTLIASLASLMPVVLAGDGREIPVATIGFENPAAPGAGSIRIRHLMLQAVDHAYANQALGATVAEVVLQVNGTIWAQASLTPDSVHATLAGASELEVDADSSLAIEVRLTPRSGLESGTLRVGFDAAGVGVVQPSGGVLQIQVLPAPGQTFPLWTEAGGFGPLELAASYSNFPNPFAAGREATSFAYYMNGDGRVWLRLYTLAGEPVRTLADGEPRTAGMQQVDRWDGLNGTGHTVRSGVYIAELRVQYDAGASARALRKVAVRR